MYRDPWNDFLCMFTLIGGPIILVASLWFMATH